MNQKPVSVYAQAPIDLELGGDGATPWNIDNIAPGDSGVNMVSLRNAGDEDGTVFMWISDIEERDYRGDGAVLDDFLLFGTVSNRLKANIAMPSLIRGYPQNIAGAKSIHIDRLRAGETVTFAWEWEFPLIGKNHNLAQGDSLSFTINYYLEELVSENTTQGVEDQPGEQEEDTQDTENLPVVQEKTTQGVIYQLLDIDILGKITKVQVNDAATIMQSCAATSPDEMFTLFFNRNTNISRTGEIPLSRIELTAEEISIPMPDNIVHLTPIYRLTGYDTEGEKVHIEFSPAVELTIRYDPGKIPGDFFPPYIARYTDEEGLIPLESHAPSQFSPGKVGALLDSSSLLMVLAETAPQLPLLPANFTASNLKISSNRVFEGDPVKISVTITNESPESNTYELYLIIDGIVRAVQEVTLSGNSSKTLTFEITNLAAGTHQIKIAGLTENIRIEPVVVEQVVPEVDWMVLDLSVAGTITAGLLVWLLYMLRARRRAIGIGI